MQRIKRVFKNAIEFLEWMGKGAAYAIRK